MAFIETWGTTSKLGGRQALTYAARERGGLVAVELISHQAREMAATLHMLVFSQLAARKGQRRSHARSQGGDYGSLATMTKQALEEARVSSSILQIDRLR